MIRGLFGAGPAWGELRGRRAIESPGIITLDVADLDRLGGNYKGYLWCSDQPFPNMIDGESATSGWLGELPFVVEGQLFDDARKSSLRIIHIDGRYRIAEMHVPHDYAQRSHVYYASSKFAKFSDKDNAEYDLQLRFYTHYEEQPTPDTDDFAAELPAWTAFVGFSEELVTESAYQLTAPSG